jgi:hypothetical protein
MPYYRTQTYSAAATTVSWNLDPAIVPFAASIVVTLSAGTTSYKLQYSLNPLDGPLETDASATWVDWPDIPAGTAASAQTTIQQPVARIRLVIASLSGGTLTMQARQGLSTN